MQSPIKSDAVEYDISDVRRIAENGPWPKSSHAYFVNDARSSVFRRASHAINYHISTTITLANNVCYKSSLFTICGVFFKEYFVTNEDIQILLILDCIAHL